MALRRSHWRTREHEGGEPAFEDLCLRRGLATFAFDGPGQGEVFFDVKARPDFERYASAVVDEANGIPNSTARGSRSWDEALAAFTRFGRPRATRASRACVAWSFFYDLSDFDGFPKHTQQGFAYVSGYDDVEAEKRYVQEALTLADVAEEAHRPDVAAQWSAGSSVSRRPRIFRCVGKRATRRRARAGGRSLLPQHQPPRTAANGRLAT